MDATLPSTHARVAVVGGGLAGLAAAQRLRLGGASPILLEAAAEVGGRVKQVKPQAAHKQSANCAKCMSSHVAFEITWQLP